MDSYWIDSCPNTINSISLDKDLKTDVCIIGGGIFGLSTAYYLCKNNVNVVVLDKDNIGYKTSGHTTAKITSQHGLIYKYLKNSFGDNFAKNYLEANEEAITNIKNIIDNENIECNFEYQNSYVYTTDFSEVLPIQNEVDCINSLGFNAKYVTECSLPFKIKCAIEFPNQAQFHPRKYMIGLANAILKDNGKIYTNSKVYNVNNEDGIYTTFTEHYKVQSKYVVIASHYPFINVPGFYFTKMYQSTSYIIGVDTKSKLFDGMYINTKSPIFSYRTVPYNNTRLLLVGGSDHKTGNSVNFNSTYGVLESEVKKHYPDSEILYRWNTRDCITLDKVPYIGNFSNIMENMYIGTGFNKWGMTCSNVAANIVKDKILDIENKYESTFNSTRMSPIKNRIEVKNMIKQSVKSIVIDKFKIPTDITSNLSNDSCTVTSISGNTVGIYKDCSGNLFAVKPVCTHLGCLLNWNDVDKTWDCPCHGSRFDYKGKNLYDPAIKDLESYTV